MRINLKTLVVPGLLLACIVAYWVLFLPAGTVDKGVFSVRTSFDFHSHFLPKFMLGNEELLAGRLPVWNPYEYGGLPLLATAQASVFYPPKIIAFGLFDPITAYWVYLYAHYLLLAFGAYALFREQKMSQVSAFVGAAFIVFALPVVGSNYHPTRLANLSWIPIAYLLTDRLGVGKGKYTFAWVAVVVALQLTSGYPEYSLDLSILLAVHCLTRWATSDWQRPPWRTVPVLAGAFLIAAVVAAAQILPLVEVGLEAKRAIVAKSGDWQEGMGNAPPALIAAVSMFPGLVALSALGLLPRLGRPAAAGLFTCLIMGNGGWLALRELPGFSMIRFPWVWFLIVPFFIAWLAAAGCEAYLREGESTKRARGLAGVVIALGGVGWAVYCAVRFYNIGAGIESSGEGWERLSFNVSTRLPAVIGIIGGLALAANTLPALQRRFGHWGLLGSFIVLTVGHVSGYPFGATPAPVERPAKHGWVSSLFGPGNQVSGRTFAIDDIMYGYDLTERHESLFGAEISFVPWRFREIIVDLEYAPYLNRIAWSKLARSRGFLDAMNVQFVVSAPEIKPLMKQAGFRLVKISERGALYENPDRMGPGWVNYAVRSFEKPEDAKKWVMARRFDPHNFVILEHETRYKYPKRTKHRPTYPKIARRVSATDYLYVVELPRPGIFVVSQSAFPGWDVFIDGAPAEWKVANYVMRGVELDKGRHLVRYVYRPWSVRWGLALSSLGILIVVGLFAGPALKRRLRRRPSESGSKAPESRDGHPDGGPEPDSRGPGTAPERGDDPGAFDAGDRRDEGADADEAGSRAEDGRESERADDAEGGDGRSDARNDPEVAPGSGEPEDPGDRSRSE